MNKQLQKKVRGALQELLPDWNVKTTWRAPGKPEAKPCVLVRPGPMYSFRGQNEGLDMKVLLGDKVRASITPVIVGDKYTPIAGVSLLPYGIDRLAYLANNPYVFESSHPEVIAQCTSAYLLSEYDQICADLTEMKILSMWEPSNITDQDLQRLLLYMHTNKMGTHRPSWFDDSDRWYDHPHTLILRTNYVGTRSGKRKRMMGKIHLRKDGSMIMYAHITICFFLVDENEDPAMEMSQAWRYSLSKRYGHRVKLSHHLETNMAIIARHLEWSVGSMYKKSQSMWNVAWNEAA